MFDFLKLKSEIASVGGKIRALRAESEKLKRRREDLATAPVTREDVLRLMLSQVNEAAARYPKRLREAIDATTQCGVPSCMNHEGDPKHVGIFTVRRHASIEPKVYDVEASLCFILQPQLKAALERAVKEMPWPDGAQPLEGRAEAIEKLDKEIAKLEAEEKELRSEAAAAGVAISA
ncbi:MAG: hypothetical protein C3F19_11635 [Rhodocyclales bacterium]|jgi:cell division protein FtsB|nr:MAG: hypothetical protein C3F19_11635 [Rhodocyclales bacterium]